MLQLCPAIHRIQTVSPVLRGQVQLLLLAATLVIIGAAAGSWAAGLVQPLADEQHVPWLTYVVHVGVILFGLLFAMDLLRVTFAEDVVKIVIASTTIALAIAFGVGGIDAAKKWWAKYGSPADSDSDRGSTNF